MESILRNSADNSWITLLIFGSLIFVIVAKKLFHARFLNFIILPFNNKYIFMYNKKEKLGNWFHVFFTIFQIINFSLFLFLSYQILVSDVNYSKPVIYFVILGGLVLFLTLKIILQLSNGFVFNNNKIITEIIFKKMSYLNHSSILMFIANVILTYIAKDSSIVVYITISLVILENSIGLIDLLKNHQKFLANNFFYFILYLCALEIGPIIIVRSLLK